MFFVVIRKNDFHLYIRERFWSRSAAIMKITLQTNSSRVNIPGKVFAIK